MALVTCTLIRLAAAWCRSWVSTFNQSPIGGVAFEISDYEDDRISFFCAEIEILSVEADDSLVDD